MPRPPGGDRIAEYLPASPLGAVRGFMSATLPDLLQQLEHLWSINLRDRPAADQGLTRLSKIQRDFFSVAGDMFCCFANHSSAITEKLLAARSSPAAFIALRCAPGSMPVRNCFRAESCFSCASARLVSE